MKTKRGNSFLTLLAFCLLLCWACSDSKDDPGPGTGDVLTVSKEALTFNAAGGTETFTVTAGKNNWIIDVGGKPEGISVAPLSGGAGEVVVSVTATENKGEDSRLGTLVIRQEGNTDTIRVTLKQDGITPMFSIETDSLALVAFYNSLGGKDWKNVGGGGKLSSRTIGEYPWDLTQPLRTWQGVYVDEVGGKPRVTQIFLENVEGVKGTLPEQISDLRELITFNITDANQITGMLPEGIFRWTKCRAISMLQMIQLTWNVPERISEMKALKSLQLQGLNMKMDDFAKLYGLTSLDSLYIGTGTLQGTVPAGISGLNNLICLNLGGCSSISLLPEDLCNIGNLQELNLGGCKKLKTLPDNIGNLGKLSKLYLTGSKITTLPASFSKLSALTFLHMSSMNVAGDADILFSGMPRMEELQAGYNGLTGTLEWLTGMKSLKILDISGNLFAGELRIKDMFSGNIEIMMLASNALTGNLSGVEILINVKTMSFSDCQLSGGIPKEFAQIHPSTCFLSGNNLTGNIPAEMKDFMKNMSLPLNLTNNRLSGILPQEIVAAWLPQYGDYICEQKDGYGFDNCADNK